MKIAISENHPAAPSPNHRHTTMSMKKYIQYANHTAYPHPNPPVLSHHTSHPSCIKYFHLVSALHLVVTLHSLRISWWHRTTTASHPRARAIGAIVVPSAVLVLMDRRCHGSRSAVSSLNRSNRFLWYSSLAAICGLDDHVCYMAMLRVLGKLVVVGFGEFGDDVPCV